MRHVTATVDRIGLLQIDSVNVLTRAHYLPLFSRLGPYDRALLDRASGRAPRRLVEYWAHEASLVPPSTQRLLRWRMRRSEEAWGGMRSIAAQRPDLVQAVRDELKDRTVPMTAGQVEAALEHDVPRAKVDWGWNWSEVKRALEFLFYAGEISSAGRTTSFERRYAVPGAGPAARRRRRAGPQRPRGVRRADPDRGPGARRRERALPARLLPAPSGRLARGGRRTGRQPASCCPWRSRAGGRPGYLHRDARLPRRVDARALLVPFDPLVWFRWRAEHLFGFHYRIEIYVPAEKRVHGYYVLPFLLGDRLVARVDLKADRQSGALLVRSAYAEDHAPPETAAELAAELHDMARWLDLDDVRVEERGDLAAALSVEVSAGLSPSTVPASARRTPARRRRRPGRRRGRADRRRRAGSSRPSRSPGAAPQRRRSTVTPDQPTATAAASGSCRSSARSSGQPRVGRGQRGPCPGSSRYASASRGDPRAERPGGRAAGAGPATAGAPAP